MTQRPNAKDGAGTRGPAGKAPDAYSAVILAGKRPGVDAAAEAGGQTYKALIEIGGAPMILRPLRAVCASKHVKRVTIVAEEALGPIEAIRGFHDCLGDTPVAAAPARESISESVLRALDEQSLRDGVLVTTADHALLTVEILDEFLRQAEGRQGICVGFVAKETIDKAYPDMKRTYLTFRDGRVSSANLFALKGAEALNAVRFWRNVEQRRKTPWRLAAAFGFVNLIGFVSGAFTLHAAFRRASSVLQCAAHPILLDVADAAIDVDKPADLALVKELLAKREGR